MNLLLDDLIGRSTYLDGTWEGVNTEAAKVLVQQGNNVFDVGANAGYFSLLFASLVGDSGKVYAFEPLARTAMRLRENLALNAGLEPRVRVFESALSDVEGDVNLDSEGDSNTGATRVVSIAAHAPGSPSAGVPCRTADSVWVELGSPNVELVKIDIEGHEIFALKGMRMMLSEQRGVTLLIEVRDAALKESGSSRAELFSLMESHGLASYDYNAPTATFARNNTPRDGELIVFSKRVL